MKRTIYTLLASMLMLMPTGVSAQTETTYHDGDLFNIMDWTFQITSVAENTCQLGGMVDGKRVQGIPTADSYYSSIGSRVSPDENTYFRVTAIADGACYGCTKMSGLWLNNGVETIGEEAFYDCESLQEFHLPLSLKSIGKHAFYGCSKLERIISDLETPFPLDDVFDDDVYENTVLEVPYGLIDTYLAVPGWNQFKHIEEGLNPFVSDDLMAGYYYMRNVATGLYVTNGGRYGTHIYTGPNGLELELESTRDAKHCHIYSGFYSSDYEDGAIGQGGYVDATNRTDMLITRVAEGIYTIMSENGSLMATNDDNREVNFKETTADDPHAQWEIIDYYTFGEERSNKLSEATPDNPVDATYLIYGANLTNTYDRGFYNWQYDFDLTTTNVNLGAVNSDCQGIMEVFRSQETKSSAAFQFYQGIYPPPGKYKLEVQGFYRDGSYAVSSNRRKNGKEVINAYLFGGHERAPLKSIYDEAKEEKEKGYSQKTTFGYIPNTMADADYCFQTGAYDNELYFTVPEDYFGDYCIYVGIVTDVSTVFNNWTAFDNFRLTYYGYDVPDGIADVSRKEVKPACYSLDGKRASKPAKGLNIMRRSDGTVRKVFVK